MSEIERQTIISTIKIMSGVMEHMIEINRVLQEMVAENDNQSNDVKRISK